MLRPDPAALTSPWSHGTVELAGDYRGLAGDHRADVSCGCPAPDARFGVLSDIDDTILETGVQRAARMVRQTIAGSALTRSPFPGAPELYRDLAADGTTRSSTSPPAPGTCTPSCSRSCATATSRSARSCCATCSAPPRRAGAEGRADPPGPRPAPRPVVRADRRLGGARPRDLRRGRAHLPRPDPRRLHPRGAPGPRRRPGRGRSPAPGTTTSPSSSPPTPTPYAATRSPSASSRKPWRSSRAAGPCRDQSPGPRRLSRAGRPRVETERGSGVRRRAPGRSAQPPAVGVGGRVLRRLSRAGRPVVETRAAKDELVIEHLFTSRQSGRIDS